MFGVAAIYNIFSSGGESLGVQSGGLGGIPQKDFIEFQLHSNCCHCSLELRVFYPVEKILSIF